MHTHLNPGLAEFWIYLAPCFSMGTKRANLMQLFSILGSEMRNGFRGW